MLGDSSQYTPVEIVTGTLAGYFGTGVSFPISEQNILTILVRWTMQEAWDPWFYSSVLHNEYHHSNTTWKMAKYKAEKEEQRWNINHVIESLSKNSYKENAAAILRLHSTPDQLIKKLCIKKLFREMKEI